MNAYSIPAIPLQPYQELAVRFALNRFLTRYRTPPHDRHEWRVECLREAICAVLCADADEPPTTLSALGLDAEDGILGSTERRSSRVVGAVERGGAGAGVVVGASGGECAETVLASGASVLWLHRGVGGAG